MRNKKLVSSHTVIPYLSNMDLHNCRTLELYDIRVLYSKKDYKETYKFEHAFDVLSGDNNFTIIKIYFYL